MEVFWFSMGARADMGTILGTSAGLNAGIAPGEIHIYLLRLQGDLRTGPRPDLLALLPPDEQGRAGEILSEERRAEFLWSRLFLRRILASYLREEMKEFEISLGDKGKPFLMGSRLQFNLSHKPGLIACSFGWDPLGIDVEKVEDSPEARKRWGLIAQRYFSSAQRERLLSLPVREQSRFFFKIFTLKEAQGKAIGIGLSNFTSEFTFLPPSDERFRSGFFEYFVSAIEGDHQLAHVVENSGRKSHKYSVIQWTTEYLVSLLEPEVFPNTDLFRATRLDINNSWAGMGRGL